MPISLPNLDDRTFADLAAELRGLIPRFAPQWTNHNPSDPGITLLELLAWLAEMVVYRLNRIPRRSLLVLLGYMGIEPAAPMAEVVFRLQIDRDALPEGFEIPRATQTAAIDATSGEEIVFETTTPVSATQGRWDEEDHCWLFKSRAVNLVKVEDEFIGVGDGTVNQEFFLQHPPLFLNRDDESDDRDPVIVGRVAGSGDTRWAYRRDLLDARAFETVFTVDLLAGLVRFGGESNGAVPPDGMRLFCTYRKLGGVRGNVAAGAIHLLKTHLLGEDDANQVTVTNEYAAGGGVDDEDLEQLLTRGLLRAREPYRLVSADDFENITMQAAPGRVARVKAIFDRNLERSTPTGKGHVSLIVLPARSFLNSPSCCLELQSELTRPKVRGLYQDILSFLEQRRLITTVLHTVLPEFRGLELDIDIRARSGRDLIKLQTEVETAIHSFLDPYEGGEDGLGWPFGRDVFRSEIYQRIESLEGVDHVWAMKMNGDDQVSLFALEEEHLVCLKQLTVTIR